MMSVPRTTSARSGEQTSSAGKNTAGRRFAYAPSSRRRRNNPASGRKCPGFASNAGLQTAPNSTAPEARQAEIVSAGRGALMAARRRRASNQFGLKLKFVAKAVSHSLQNLHSLSGHFRANAVAGKNREIKDHDGIVERSQSKFSFAPAMLHSRRAAGQREHREVRRFRT